MKSSTSFRTAVAVGALFAIFTQPASAAAVTLKFGVSNVVRDVCAGLTQPTCTLSSANSFTESLTIDISAPLTSDNGGAGIRDTTATFGFPFRSTGNPYTSGLNSILGQAPTSATSFSQFENLFDTSPGGTGLATGLIFTDQSYNNGAGSTGEYSQNYSVQSFLNSIASYQDLTAISLANFLIPLINQLSGSYFEFGTASVLDQGTLAFTSYAYTSYGGDATLIGVEAIPEPATLALIAAGLAGVGLKRRSRRGLVSRA